MTSFSRCVSENRLAWLILICLLAFGGCHSSAGSKAAPTKPASAVQMVKDNTSAQPLPGTGALPAPKPEEIRNAVGRVLGDLVTVDFSHPNYFVSGDFNGDGSQDLAVFVRPVPRFLGKLNNKDIADWIFGAPKEQVLLGRDPTVVLPKAADGPIVIRPGEVLLCVIHGYGADGWRDWSSRQTYLLKGVAGRGLRAVERKTFMSEHKHSVPNVPGDVILEDISGHQGFLYYNSANYGWLALLGR